MDRLFCPGVIFHVLLIVGAYARRVHHKASDLESLAVVRRAHFIPGQAGLAGLAPATTGVLARHRPLINARHPQRMPSVRPMRMTVANHVGGNTHEGFPPAPLGPRMAAWPNNSLMGNARLSIKSGVAVVPHPDKAHREYKLPPYVGGEDAYFVDDEAGILGVADGVGGWASKGIDPGIFSRQLMSFAAEEAKGSTGTVDPVGMLSRAHARTTVPGSSTAIILALGQETGELRVANLGDSGFLHLRRGQVLFQSPPMQHQFNYPFQLTAPDFRVQGDKPSAAETFTLQEIQPGDVIVAGSDGLFDNAHSTDIAAMVQRATNSGATGAELAKRVADELAHQTALWANDANHISPFEEEVTKERPDWDYRGGKPDDITVVVAVVESKPRVDEEFVKNWLENLADEEGIDGGSR